MKFSIKHFLIATGVVCIVLAAILLLMSPIIQSFRNVRADQHRIKNHLDHAAILECAALLLTESPKGAVANADLPQSIASTQPKYVHVVDGAVHIEYGSGFSHYGLIVDPGKMHHRNASNQTNGAYYSEETVRENVYYYETE